MITVNGKKYKVTDKGSYSHDIGHYWKKILVDGEEKMVVGRPGFGDFGLLKITFKKSKDTSTLVKQRVTEYGVE